jgi:nitronate monooxygenase
MRAAAIKEGDAERMQLWAGQSAKLAQERPAGLVCEELWREAERILG